MSRLLYLLTALGLGAVAWASLLLLGDLRGIKLALFLLPLIAVALALGAAFPSNWALSPLLMVVAPLALGHTIDRGDEDGLWILIYPLIIFTLVFVLYPAAYAGARWRRQQSA